jgi:hypothetical protein
MATFEFKNNTIELKIAGDIYHVKPTPELTDRIIEFEKKWFDMVSDAENGVVENEKFISQCKIVIDVILGAGAFEKIFAGRVQNIEDCTDVAVFIFNEITGWYGGDRLI